MSENHKIIGKNIVEDNIETLVNNGDINYHASPCVVMNNLINEHNQYVDKMGDVSMSRHAYGVAKHSNNGSINNTSSGVFKNLSSASDIVEEVKSFDPPVDYETAFGEYYPNNENSKELPKEQKRS